MTEANEEYLNRLPLLDFARKIYEELTPQEKKAVLFVDNLNEKIMERVFDRYGMTDFCLSSEVFKYVLSTANVREGK